MSKFKIPTSFTLEPELMEKIERKANQLDITKSALIRKVLFKYFNPNDKKGVENV